MWMFTGDQDSAFLQAIGRMKQIWKELCLMRLDTPASEVSGIFGESSASNRFLHFAVSCPPPESYGYYELMSTHGKCFPKFWSRNNSSEGVFTSCNGELVQIVGNSLVLRTSCAEERKSRIKEVTQTPLLSFLKRHRASPGHGGWCDDHCVSSR